MAATNLSATRKPVPRSHRSKRRLRLRRFLRNSYHSTCTLVTYVRQKFMLMFHILLRLIRHLCYRLIHFSAWLQHHFLTPLLCFICIYTGIMLTFPLPTALWHSLAQPMLNYLNVTPIINFPLANIPDSSSLARAAVSALPLAIAVFRRHFNEWRASGDPLGARMLYACYAGVVWPRAWWRSDNLLNRSRQR
jgi:hypothetical protein